MIKATQSFKERYKFPNREAIDIWGLLSLGSSSHRTSAIAKHTSFSSVEVNELSQAAEATPGCWLQNITQTPSDYNIPIQVSFAE